MWDPDQYLRYGDHRARPFLELVSRVGADTAASVVDLGCGAGNLSPIISTRWPGARVVGVDRDESMLAEARAAADGRVEYVAGDIERWSPGEAVDVVLSNAALHWVPQHLELLGRFVSWLRPGGWLAFQVPGNQQAPSHTELADLRRSERWRARVGAGADTHVAVHPPGVYLDRLGELGCTTDVWETTYLQVLDGDDPVFEWVKGSALRPVLARLEPGEATRFEAEYRRRLALAYPRRADGTTVFAFRRVFVVAQRSD